MLVLEAEVFQFGLDAEQAEAVRQWGVDVLRLARYLVLLGRRHGVERAHVVQAVGYLDEDDAHVLAHGEDELAEVLRLRRGLAAEHAARYLGEAVHDLGDFLAEEVLDVLHGVVGVLHHVVQQGRADGGGAHADFVHHDARHGQRVHDVRLARTAADAFVRRVGEVERLGDKFHLLAVVRGQVVLHQRFELLLDLFVLLGQDFLLFLHRGSMYEASQTPPGEGVQAGLLFFHLQCQSCFPLPVA